MKTNKLRSNVDGLEEIQKTLERSKKYRAQIGIFKNKDGRTEGDTTLGNADIGFRHEFGYTIQEGGPFDGVRVPARSFLMMPMATRKGEIAKQMASSIMALLVTGRLEMLFDRLGKAAKNIITQAFLTSGWGSWKANSPITVQLKRSAMPLIDTSNLLLSVDNRVKKQ